MLGEWLRLLGDPSRLRLMHLLAGEPLTVSELQHILGSSQSSISGHLSKLKQAGFIHAVTEGSANRYRLRDDLDKQQIDTWSAVSKLSSSDPLVTQDRQALAALIAERQQSWVERVAGSLNRAYSPGRTWEGLAHTLAACVDLGVTCDIGAGDGSLIELLAPCCSTLYCLEPSPAMRKAAENILPRWPQATYLAGSGESNPLENDSVDTVLSLQSLQYTDKPEQVLAEAQRILRPGGRLLLLTLQSHDFSEADQYGHQHPGFTPEQLQAWSPELSSWRCYPLAAESRPPHFTSLLVSARK